MPQTQLSTSTSLAIVTMSSNNMNNNRLGEKDADIIFSCLANNERPPERLDFNIIRVPKNGQKFSPPSLELENGMYVLLKGSETPSSLTDRVLSADDLSTLARCPWSLSGPQQKDSSKTVQQRYCYPRGSTNYSSDKGAIMYTKVDDNGVEGHDVRVVSNLCCVCCLSCMSQFRLSHQYCCLCLVTCVLFPQEGQACSQASKEASWNACLKQAEGCD